jgi:hypothetical protein
VNEVSSNQLRKVQKFSVYARACCSVLMVLLTLSVGLVLFALFDNPDQNRVKFFVGGFLIAASPMRSPAVLVWLLATIAAAVAFSVALIWTLRRIFDNLSRGEIFSVANVGAIRRIAFIALSMGLANVLFLVGNIFLTASGLFDPRQVAVVSRVELPGLVTPFAVAGIVYLASWIMAVGLGVREDAEELQRDAELVI